MGSIKINYLGITGCFGIFMRKEEMNSIKFELSTEYKEM